ncbi:MAG: hypothetical protein ABIR17_07645 [Pseudolysinimonas sp.]|uniref:hypothetical protein n=1 Tax=Pseudolysinimonas sp. TaxID=2680009 RepID=UPI003266D454
MTTVRPVSRTLPLLAWAGIGVGAVIVGLLPWIISGMHLPLQYLWATATLPPDMPIVALPFSQYAITLLLGLIVTPYAVAGIVARAFRARRPPFALVVLGATMAFLQLIAMAQTAVVTRSGLTDEPAADRYVGFLSAGVALAVAIGLVVLIWVARASRPFAVVALALAAHAAGFWVNSFLGVFSSPYELSWLASLLQWVPSVLVGAAIAWGGIRSAGRVVAAVLALLLLWVVPAVATAGSATLGSYVMLPYPLEMLDYGWSVLRQALFMPELVVPHLVVAGVVAAVGLGVGEAVRRLRKPSALSTA